MTPSDPLTLRDVAVLHDRLPVFPPAGLLERLRRWVLTDARFADALSELEALARAAGLPSEMEDRLTEAWELGEDLVYLLDADGWDDPSEVLGRGVDLPSLLVLADYRARQPDPPDRLARVREKLARAVADGSGRAS